MVFKDVCWARVSYAVTKFFDFSYLTSLIVTWDSWLYFIFPVVLETYARPFPYSLTIVIRVRCHTRVYPTPLYLALVP